MNSAVPPLTETFQIGPLCRERVLSADRLPLLDSMHFVWVGLSTVCPPYRMVRLQSVHAHVVACVQGRGSVLINGEMVDWQPNQVLLAPRGTPHAFEATQSDPWLLAWIFLDDRKGPPLIEGDHARLVEADVGDFVRVLELLLHEASGEADSEAIKPLVSLLHLHTRRFTGESHSDLRLTRLWQAVESDLSHPWDAKRLARHAHLSEEHLRRLCHRYHGRTPMGQVREFRMHRACMLLRASVSKIEVIAMQVGFASLYSFSAAFKRWSGITPMLFRQGKDKVL